MMEDLTRRARLTLPLLVPWTALLSIQVPARGLRLTHEHAHPAWWSRTRDASCTTRTLELADPLPGYDHDHEDEREHERRHEHEHGHEDGRQKRSDGDVDRKHDQSGHGHTNGARDGPAGGAIVPKPRWDVHGSGRTGS